MKHTLDNRPVCDDVTVQLAVVTQLKHSIKDLAIKVQPLVFWTDAFRVVNELLQVRNGVVGVHIQFDALASGDEIHRDGDAVSAGCGSAGFVPERSRWRCLWLTLLVHCERAQKNERAMSARGFSPNG